MENRELKTDEFWDKVTRFFKKNNLSGMLYSENNGSKTICKNYLNKLAVIHHAKIEIEHEKITQKESAQNWSNSKNIRMSFKDTNYIG